MFFIISCDNNSDSDSAVVINPAEPDYTLENIYLHNESYYTQGFEFSDDILVEGTGKYGVSRLIKYNFSTEEIYSQINLDSVYFGEGITIFNNAIYQITWRENRCFKYSLDSLKLLDEFSYSGEGWGLTHDSISVIMSNGSSTLYFRDPVTFDITKEITVKDSNGNSIDYINELEYAYNFILANIWYSDDIIMINPDTGIVEKRINLSDLRTMGDTTISGTNVLNGIALHPNGNLFVTGKNWPNIFEIKLVNK